MDFSNLKSMFNGLVDNVSTRATDLAGNAADKAKSAARIARLTMELGGEKDNLKKTYATIGQTYYENKAELPQELLAQLVEEADSINERINAIEAELLELKAEFGPKEADVEVSFEEVVDEAEQEAAAEETPAEEEGVTVDEVIEKVEEVIDEVKEKVEDVIEDIKGEE